MVAPAASATATKSVRPLHAFLDLDAAFPQSGKPIRGLRADVFRHLHAWYLAYLAGPEHSDKVPELNCDPQVRAIEQRWMHWEEAQLANVIVSPSADAFRSWFLAEADKHVQLEFCQYLTSEATLPEIALFFCAEELVDSRFDDLVAMVQIGCSDAAKLTIAENYWDEMGRGKLERIHTRMFEHSARYMRAQLAPSATELLAHSCEVLENACLLMCFGIHRRFAPRALGAMGLLEQSASPRFQAMVAGCERLQVPQDVIEYQREHIHVDASHGIEWFEHVLLPLAMSSPAALREICAGVLMRRRVANAYYASIWQLMRLQREES